MQPFVYGILNTELSQKNGRKMTHGKICAFVYQDLQGWPEKDKEVGRKRDKSVLQAN